MSKPPITFRLTDHEYEILEKNQQSGESINLCAARLLREKLGIVDNDGITRLEEQTLESWITDRVNDKVDNLKSYLEVLVNERVYKYVDDRDNSIREQLDSRVDNVLKIIGDVEFKIDELEKAKPKTATRTRKTPQPKTED